MDKEIASGTNADQIAYWNALAGETWAALQERVDRQIGPLGQLGFGEKLLQMLIRLGHLASFLEKFDHVRAILRIADRKHHLRSRDVCLRIGEPLVERSLAPDDVRGFQSRRIIVIRNTPGLAAEDTSMSGSNSVLIERMADHAFVIDRRPMRRIS